MLEPHIMSLGSAPRLSHKRLVQKLTESPQSNISDKSAVLEEIWLENCVGPQLSKPILPGYRRD